MKFKKARVLTALFIYLLSILAVPVGLICRQNVSFNQQNAGNCATDGNAITEVLFALSEQTLLDKYQDSGSTLSYGDYLNTAQGKAQRAVLEEKTQSLSRLITSLGGKIHNTYFDLTVGVSAEINSDKISAVINSTGASAYDNVTFKSVAEDVQLQPVAQILSTPDEKYASHNKGVYVNDTVYQGEGALVAILDSGFNVNHDCLQPLPTTQNLKLTTESLETLWNEGNLSILQSSTIASFGYREVYHSTKVPYAFDYSSKDFDVMPVTSTHGMHVAGIITGNDANTVVGAVPKSQVALMKVFDDGGFGASMDSIISALSDCAILGADVVNLSLGVRGGMSMEYTEENAFINQCMLALYEAGVVVCAAVGNDYNTGYLSELGETSASYPDNGITNSTASYYSNYAVGSVNAYYSQYVSVDGKNAVFMEYFVDENERTYDFDNILFASAQNDTVTYQYVYVGLGQEQDYAGKDVRGKIVLVDRGIDYFSTKMNVARAYGAVGMLLLNNEYGEGLFLINSDEINYPFQTPIPSYIIAKSYADAFDKQNGGTVTFAKQNKLYLSSAFSSWGPNADLAIKPEISAYGGQVYSASINFKDFSDGTKMEYMSGTSMATPNVTALCVVAKQYLQAQSFYAEATDKQLAEIIKNLLSTTATALTYPDGSYYSVRHQGAGMADLKNLTASTAYMESYFTGKAKLELGDDPNKTGKYTLDALLHNFTDVSKTYTVSVVVQTAKITADNLVMTNETHLLACDSVISVDGNATNVFATASTAGTSNRIKVKLTLSQQAKDYLDRYPNGAYVEGFLILTDGDGVQISLPWLAFYGEWDEIPFMDGTAFNNPTSENIYLDTPYVYDENGKSLGYYFYGDIEEEKAALNKFALSVVDTNERRTRLICLDLPMTKTLKSLRIHVEDKNGKQLGTKLKMQNVSKVNYVYNLERINFSFNVKDHPSLQAGDNISLCLTPELEYGGVKTSQMVKLNIYLDGTVPKIDTANTYLYMQDGKVRLKICIEEDFYLMCLKLDLGTQEIVYLPLTDSTIKPYHTFDIDISQYVSNTDAEVKVTALDYALNTSAERIVGGVA